MLIRSVAVVALLVPALAFAVTPKAKKKTVSIKPAVTTQAAAARPAVANVGTIVVTATRSAQSDNTTAASLIVINRAEIERSGASHIVEVLRARAGIEVTDTFGDGSRTLVGLRGFGENAHSNSLVLVDGRRMNNPDIGAPDLNSLPLNTIERIEIMQGSAGALYGDQAVGGVINIVTRVPNQSGGAIELNTGSYGRAGVRAQGTYVANSALRFRAHFDGRRTDNYRAHNKLDQFVVGGRGDYDWTDGAGFLEFQFDDERLQAPGALLQAELDANRRQSREFHRNDFLSTNTHVVRGGLRQSFAPRWAVEGETSHRVTDGVFRLSFRPTAEVVDASQKRRALGITPKVVGLFDIGSVRGIQLTAGTDINLSDYRLVSRFGPQSNDQQSYDAFAQAVVPVLPTVGLTAGLRYGEVHNDLQDGGAFAIFPAGQRLTDEKVAHSLGAYWYALPELKLFARHDHSFRFPKVDEFFGTFAAALAVNLKTQTGDSYETGAEYRAGGLHASVLLYRLELYDEIVFDPNTFININIARTTRDGQLLELRYPLLDTLSVAGSYAHIDARAKQGTLNNRVIPLAAEHVGRVSVEWSPTAAWNQFVEVQTTGERFFSGDFDNSLRPLPSYTVVNLGGVYRCQGWRAQARVNNVLNEEYSEFGASTFDAFFTEVPSFQPSPEINFQVTLGYEFGGNTH
ncbi:MAG: TonB-dependent receptor [Pseudomonadota bacterium]